MRILVLQDDFPPRPGGSAGAIAFSLATTYAQRGHTVLVLTTSPNREDVGEKESANFRVRTILSKNPGRWRAYRSLYNPHAVAEVKKELQSFKPEVVHAHNIHIHLSYASLRAARRSGARVILTCHDVMPFNYSKLLGLISPDDTSIPSSFNYRVSPWQQLREQRFRYNPFRNIYIRYILRTCVHHLVAVSDALAEALRQNGIPGAVTIHNSIDVSEWSVDADAVSACKTTFAIGEQAVLFGGRLSRAKGASELLQSLSIVAKSAPRVQLLVVGTEDAFTHRMKEMAAELGIKDRLVFTGWLSGKQLHTVYHAAALVCVPSICFDSFPTMNLEAMASRKPVIATCAGGSREAVVEGETGYIVNPYDTQTMAEKLTELLTDTERSIRFGEAGYERAARDFSPEGQIQKYEKLFMPSARSIVAQTVQ
jgi:glycosyltransferase involved in cell wall biosynthesis